MWYGQIVDDRKDSRKAAECFQPLLRSQRLQQAFLPDDPNVLLFGKRTTREISCLSRADSTYLASDVIVIALSGTS